MTDNEINKSCNFEATKNTYCPIYNDCIEETWEFTFTPLIVAIVERDMIKAKELLDLGADPNLCCTEYNKPPLIYAIVVGDSRIVELLLEAGAKQDYNRNVSPLLVAASEDVSILAECQEFSFMRHDRISGHYRAMVIMLLEHGANLRAESSEIFSHLAELFSTDEIIELVHKYLKL